MRTKVLGIRGRLLLRVLERDRHAAWPAGELIAAAGVSPAPGWHALTVLVQHQYVRPRPSDDGVIRFVATPAGRRALARRQG